MMEDSISLCYITEVELKRPAKHLLKALGAIHLAGYLHNDIQPSNIFINVNDMDKVSVTLDGLSRCCPISVGKNENIVN